MKKLTSAPTLVNIHHFKNLLAAEGIKTVIRNEHIGSILGALPFTELWVVNDLDFDRAQQLISGDAFEESPADEWRCASCGELNEGQFAACWKCGAATAL
jgi:hypothetical protein